MDMESKMFDVLTEEEEKLPVTFRDLKILLEVFFTSWIEAKTDEDERREKVIDEIIKTLEDISYKRIRDVKFFINVLSSLGFGTQDQLVEYYNKYCAEFDRLNKGDEKK